MRAFVVEDSRLARQGLVRMLGAHPGIEVVGEADHPDTALPLIRAARPDVLFLDIQMAGADAFDLLARLEAQRDPQLNSQLNSQLDSQLDSQLNSQLNSQLDRHPRIVFTTAHAEYAVRSFEFDTVDYLLKPVSAERLAQAVRKLEARGLPPPPDAVQAPLEAHSRIFIKDGERAHMVPLASIRCFESCRNHVQVYFGDTHAYVKKSLGSIEERLPRHLFFRVSRQHIVNLAAIASIEEAMGAGYFLRLDNGKKLEISRRNAAQLKETMSL